jgi:hypothetical protein
VTGLIRRVMPLLGQTIYDQQMRVQPHWARCGQVGRNNLYSLANSLQLLIATSQKYI